MSSFVNKKSPVFRQIDKLADKLEIENKKIKIDKTKRLTKQQFFKLFFNTCFDCCKMSAIPHGGFAVHKVRERQLLHLKMQAKNDDKNNSSSSSNGYKKNLTDEARELTPLKYNSKLMNSIWGLYNRYSPHNFKKNTDANENTAEGVFSAAWGKFLHDNTSPAQTSSARNIAVKH
ncbi:hypothetical protein HCN44_009782 [Aphidius gifuensis]|uniref:Uncharacterized protein n=1 Tax=Aphidius gifuensis TaxID=684658 RepID=A0A835CVS5_APHGI|nr:uncharacterized protein LOC122860579 [Aphidius gifuensis]KAF7998384.1 hypothetical protein HCN44_009782 [Aphidius gifuensis]